ncbi:MAG TPA: hypothetical protein DDZ80_18915 [Cyanobacteria bacterium UBA8803]|nr:hypothetical protein [Cyanobacteria bacterium UBA9273]HBL60447.1 hypothetical protein [Cyanobacteria bacterium UBA8803]
MKQYSVTRGKHNRQRTAKKNLAQSWLVTLGAIAALMAGGAAIVGGIRLGILWMIDPNAVSWLNRFLPEWTRIPIADASPPQTLAAIQDEIRQSGLIAGEPLSLNTGQTERETPILLPILKSPPNCQTDCQKIVELRVYQPAELRDRELAYQLVTQLPITEPEEYFVLSSLRETEVTNVSAYHALPLTKLSRLDDKAPLQGLWFNLSGQRIGDGTTTYYGQVIHYNPDQTHLSMMLEWTSPNDLQPYWQQVTSGTTPELVVNQTVGLEPKFKVYQIQPRKFVPNPIYLEEISLNTPAVDNNTYRNALMLARNGLWSVALQVLRTQKKTTWSPAAQAQMDLIQLHALFTQSQAQQTWASPSQQILAYLIDGRWADALGLFQSSAVDATLQEIITVLKTDSGGLWQRVTAALKVNRKDSNVKTWGALILTAQQGRAKAIAWLKQLEPNQPNPNPPSATDAQIYALLDYLDTALIEGSPIVSHLSQIVGTAQNIKTVKPADWLQLEGGEWGSTEVQNTTQTAIPNPTLSPLPNPLLLPPKRPNEVWYQVQVAAFNDGQRWRQAPFADLLLPALAPTRRLWQYLGLDLDPRIQITASTADGRQTSTMATVKAVSYRGGVIQLLAAGEALPPTKGNRHLAYSETALQWLEPGSMTLSDLNQIQPQWTAAILPTLWRELVKSGKRSPQATPNLAVMLQDIGHWLIRPIDLTGNNQQEAVLTVYENLSGGSKKLDAKPSVKDSQKYKPRTLIFSDKGALLYTEFSQDSGNSLSAIADLGDGGPAALVVEGKGQYNLKRWSAQRQRFE